ncbi:MAG: PAS domain S-box protein [Alphaproteobacteria bacterium]|nr:PAS domain S-box protein [Alphaproteobacteria bacterium]
MEDGIKSDGASSPTADDEALAEREALLRSIIETSPNGLITIDECGQILSFNPAAETMFGYQADDVIGKNVNCLMPAPYRNEHDAYIERYLKTGEKRIIGIGREVIAQRKNGEVFPVDLAVGEIRLADRRQFAGFIRDNSARRAAEQSVHTLRSELLHVSRLSELGEMASALAHELNQPLTAIINYLEACHRLLERDENADHRQTGRLMQKASDQARRAAQIIQQLRKFITKGETEHKFEPVNSVIREAAELAMVGSRQLAVTTEFDLAAGLPDIMIDRVQIQQVVMNLVRNSVEALADVEDRMLTVRTHQTADAAVQIDVIDAGPGLPDEVAQRLFQPFVTTKPGGIGIGLSICKGIVDAHGGRLWTTANPEGGTAFHISLPIDRNRRAPHV